MTQLKIAHVREQGVDMIICPLDDEFGRRTFREQQAATAEIQRAALSAGLAGVVVPVWGEGGRMTFIAPRAWHSFFQSIDLRWVWGNVNRTLSW